MMWRGIKVSFVPFSRAAEVAGYDEWWQVEPVDMGFTRANARWYVFHSEDGSLCYTMKQ